MGDNTSIEWTDATWNPIVGCSVISPGCTNCYAMRLAGTRMKSHPTRAGLTREINGNHVWTGEVREVKTALYDPLRWRRPRRIFVGAHTDIFHDAVPDAWLDRLFAVMALSPQHTFQVLTKRAERMRVYIGQRFDRHHPAMDYAACLSATGSWAHPLIDLRTWPLPNVWLGVSVEDQRRADERIPILLDTPAAVRWVSAEPLLGAIDLLRIAMPDIKYETGIHYQDVLRAGSWSFRPFFRPSQPGEPQTYFTNHSDTNRLDWIVVGGESGPGARPMHPDWARTLRDQCAGAGVPFLFKQWGEWVPQVGAVDGWTINDDPEISRFDHRDWEEGHWGDPYRPMWCDDRDDDTVSRVGKRAAGRLLDGVLHDAYPEISQ